MSPTSRKDVQARLKGVSGQVEGLQRMIEEDRYCVDVLTQISAVRAALAKIGKVMLESHIQTCVKEAFDGRDPANRAAKIEELVKVFDKNCRC